MTAARHVNPDQLSMFMPAHELVDPGKIEHYEMKYSYGSTPEHFEELKAEKLEESRTGTPENARDIKRGGQTQRESIKAEGIKTPVHMYHPATQPLEDPFSGRSYEVSGKPELGEGHHRVFTAHDLNPSTEVPVHWTKDEGKRRAVPGQTPEEAKANRFLEGDPGVHSVEQERAKYHRFR